MKKIFKRNKSIPSSGLVRSKHRVATLVVVLLALVAVVFGSVFSFAQAIKDIGNGSDADPYDLSAPSVDLDLSAMSQASEENAQTIKDFKKELGSIDARIKDIEESISNVGAAPEDRIAVKSLYDEKSDLLRCKLGLCKKYSEICIEWAQETRDLLADPIAEYEKYYEMYKERLALVYEIGIPDKSEIFDSSDSIMDFVIGSTLIKDVEEYDKQLAQKVTQLYSVVEDGLGNVKYYLVMSETYTSLYNDTEKEFFKNVTEGHERLISETADADAYNCLIGKLSSEQQSLKKLISEARDKADVDSSVSVRFDFPTSESFFYTDYIKATHGSRYLWSSVLGRYVNIFHSGVDINTADTLSDVLAAADGTVIYSGLYGLHGYTVVILHENGASTVYSGCSTVNVEIGDTVESGYAIAVSGMSGNSDQFGFTFEIFEDGKFVDPAEHLTMPDVSLG